MNQPSLATVTTTSSIPGVARLEDGSHVTFEPNTRREAIKRTDGIVFGERRNGRRPNAGEKIYATIVDRRVTVWGFADEIESVQTPAPTPVDLDALWEKKAGNCFALITIFPGLRSQLTLTEQRVFLEFSKSEEELWRDFRPHREHGFLPYAKRVIQESASNVLGPKSCQQGQFRGFLFSEAARKLTITDNETVLGVYFEERPALDKVLPEMCHGCHKTACPHFAKYANARERRRR